MSPTDLFMKEAAFFAAAVPVTSPLHTRKLDLILRFSATPPV